VTTRLQVGVQNGALGDSLTRAVDGPDLAVIPTGLAVTTAPTIGLGLVFPQPFLAKLSARRMNLVSFSVKPIVPQKNPSSTSGQLEKAVVSEHNSLFTFSHPDFHRRHRSSTGSVRAD